MNKVVLLAGMLSATLFTKAQTVSNFENFNLKDGSYYNGSDQPFGTSFSSGDAIFPNYFDTTYGPYWSGGWAYSNLKDTATVGTGNMYACSAGQGYSSPTFAVGQNGAKIILKGTALGKVVSGLYVTNSKYAQLSMQYGDFFAKKFGGETGNDADWFKLSIKKYLNGKLSTDSVDFYLANFMPKDSKFDIIVKDWQWVDLSSLGNCDSLLFSLSSSDVGDYGMNTPGFFCIDNLTTLNASSTVSPQMVTPEISVFPNPSADFISISGAQNLSSLQIRDAAGQVVLYGENNKTTISLEKLSPGIYFLSFNLDGQNIQKTIVKN